MWTVVNLVDRFSARYDFYIVTRNYDSKSDRRPYDTVVTGAWNRVGKAQVFYVSNASFTPASAAQRFQEVRPDIVFLNSAFSMPVRQFLRARRTGRIPERPVVLAPCGEMSEGALSVKPLKKTLFLKLAHNAGLYKGAIWKASFDSEAEEIRRVMGDVEILTAPDLAPRAIFPDYNVELKPEKVPGSARIAFFSRVVRRSPSIRGNGCNSEGRKRQSEPGAVATGPTDCGFRIWDLGFGIGLDAEFKSEIRNPNSQIGSPGRYRSRF